MRVAGLFFVFVACGHSGASVAPWKTGTVIESAGAEPRQPLRYQFAAGQVERYELDLGTRITSVGAGGELDAKLPIIRTVQKFEVVELMPDGVARISVTTESAHLVGDTPFRGRAVMEQITAKLPGQVIERRLSPRGLVASPSPGSENPFDNLTMDLLEHMLWPDLSDDAVGAGARWDYVASRPLAHGSLVVKSHRRLTAITSDHDDFEQDLTIEAPSQVLDSQRTLKRLEGNGEAKLAWSPAALVPTGTSSLALTVTVEDHRRTSAVRIELSTAVRRVPN